MTETKLKNREEFARKLDCIMAIDGLKVKMLENGLMKAKATCPSCDGKNKLKLSLAPVNKHVHAKCECGFQFME